MTVIFCTLIQKNQQDTLSQGDNNLQWLYNSVPEDVDRSLTSDDSLLHNIIIIKLQNKTHFP